MRYFLVKSNPLYTNMPFLKTLPDGIDIRDITVGKSYKIPKISLAFVYESEKLDFIDLISSPMFLLSDMCIKVLKMYDRSITYKYVALLDTKNKQVQTYNLPILTEIDCLTENSRFNLDKSVIKYAQIDLSKVGDKSVFKIGGVKSSYIVFRLDVLESMLKRGARGILIEEIDVIKREVK